MTEYSALKVPELKKILSERSLPVSGKKEELIARLEENDKSTTAPKPTATAEDEIDWDDEDAKPAEQPSAQPTDIVAAAGGPGPVDTPVAVPNQVVDTDPSTTSDLKVAKAPDSETAVPPKTEPAASEPEAPKVDYSLGMKGSSAETEAEKRAARAKRFNLPTEDENNKALERAKKFGTEAPETVTKGLDEALPERKPKRGRGDDDTKRVDREAKRQQTPKTQSAAESKAYAKPANGNSNSALRNAPKSATGKKFGSVLDDPVERAKAEARAAKFGGQKV